MHKARNVIGTILCFCGAGLPERSWEFNQYLWMSVSILHLRQLAAVYFLQSSE